MYTWQEVFFREPFMVLSRSRPASAQTRDRALNRCQTTEANIKHPYATLLCIDLCMIHRYLLDTVFFFELWICVQFGALLNDRA